MDATATAMAAPTGDDSWLPDNVQRLPFRS
jgi:hypothetical protein